MCAWPHAYVEVEFGCWYQPNLMKWKQFRFKLTCAYVSNVPKLGEKFIPATLIKTNGPQLSFRRSPLRRGRRDRARGPRNKPCCLSEVRKEKRIFLSIIEGDKEISNKLKFKYIFPNTEYFAPLRMKHAPHLNCCQRPQRET